MKNLLAPVTVGALLVAAGCTWVSPSPAVKTQGIMVLPQDRVEHCQLLSKTQVSIADSVGFINRVQADVEKDLQNMAMNQAVTQGGDTVSPVTSMDKGTQTFGIYKCLGSSASTPTKAPSAGSAVQTRPFQPPR